MTKYQAKFNAKAVSALHPVTQACQALLASGPPRPAQYDKEGA